MVQIKIKGINDTYHIYAQYDDASAFFQQLKERLKFCQNKNGQYFEAFFHIEGLKPQHLQELFQLCADCHTLIAGINELPQEKSRRILDRSCGVESTTAFMSRCFCWAISVSRPS